MWSQVGSRILSRWLSIKRIIIKYGDLNLEISLFLMSISRKCPYMSRRNMTFYTRDRSLNLNDAFYHFLSFFALNLIY